MLMLKIKDRLALTFSLLFIIGLVVIFAALYNSAAYSVRNSVMDQLGASARVLERVFQDRVTRLSESADLLVRDYDFRNAIHEGRANDIEAALTRLRLRLDFDRALVLDPLYEPITHVSESGRDFPVSRVPDALMREAARTGSAVGVVEWDGVLQQLVITPVLAPSPQAWIVFGSDLDEMEALKIRSLSPVQLNVAFLFRRGGADNWQLAAATSRRQALSKVVGAPIYTGTDPVGDFVLDGETVLGWRTPVATTEGGTEIAALFYHNLDTAMEAYHDLGLTLLGIGILGIGAMVVGSYVVAGAFTRPLRNLLQSAHLISQGRYRHVRVPGQIREFRRLAESFNTMARAIEDRESRLLEQARTDSETGMPNRRSFEATVAQRLSREESFGVMVMEVQHLAQLRATLNHENLTELMAQAGERLHHATGLDVARISSDSFALVVDRPSELANRAEAVLEAFVKPLSVDGMPVDVGLRLGGVVAPDHGDTVADLLRRGSIAVDQAINAGDGWALYDGEQDRSMELRLSVMSELREGIDNGEVGFAYQPAFDLQTGRVVGAEALVRWQSVSRGFIPPDEFIPLAEQTGDIRTLTRYGLECALAQVARWQRQGHDLKVGFNLSATDLINPDLPAEISLCLSRLGLKADCLKLEVTESALMRDMERALEVLDQLARLGIWLAIDDYGTGYSSLSYIKRLPVNELKIDKSFVLNLAREEEDRILVRSTVEMAHNLGLKVTAEGVEDARSAVLLRSYGCDWAQGFHLGRPGKPEDIPRIKPADLAVE
ncbi:putative bifunctional diguanylate cyclase/phosphodiesterase [Yunchengibacter salinarum]|uniref:putative bifunctional diguanylate cyclase/phosphodiesterase n=1 Tax=Yunchengibacter salinarum TaxID=3133399 RepID=UPI0035B66201